MAPLSWLSPTSLPTAITISATRFVRRLRRLSSLDSFRVRNSDGLPSHVIKIGPIDADSSAILIGKLIDKDLKPKGHSGRFGTKDDAALPNLVADRAAMQTVDLQLARKAHCFPAALCLRG